MNDKQIITVLVWTKLLDEIFQVILEEHPEIIARCIVQVVTKNPELFKDALEQEEGDKKK